MLFHSNFINISAQLCIRMNARFLFSVCNDRTAFIASRVTGCAAQNLYAPEHSDVCLTAIHAGLLTSAGGEFAVQATAAGVDYQSCVANGTRIN